MLLPTTQEDNMKRLQSVGLGLVIVAAVVLLVAVPPAAAAAPPFVFEDRNNNGVFDGSDVDITQRLLEDTWFTTTESVVVTGGPLRAIDPHWAQTDDSGGVFIHAGKNITVLSSILAPYHTSAVALFALDTIRIGSNVTLDAKDYVMVGAHKNVVIGDKVRIQSKAGSDNMTLISVVSEVGDIHIGSGFMMTTRFASRIMATNGTVVLGPGSQITSTKDSTTLIAGTNLTVDAAKIKASTGADFVAGTGSLSMRSGSVSVADGPIYIHAYHGSADLRGTKFHPTPDTTALSVIW
jgi:hypothetical protein